MVVEKWKKKKRKKKKSFESQFLLKNKERDSAFRFLNARLGFFFGFFLFCLLWLMILISWRLHDCLCDCGSRPNRRVCFLGWAFPNFVPTFFGPSFVSFPPFHSIPPRQSRVMEGIVDVSFLFPDLGYFLFLLLFLSLFFFFFGWIYVSVFSYNVPFRPVAFVGMI